MAQVNITLNQEEILQLFKEGAREAFRRLKELKQHPESRITGTAKGGALRAHIGANRQQKTLVIESLRPLWDYNA